MIASSLLFQFEYHFALQHEYNIKDTIISSKLKSIEIKELEENHIVFLSTLQVF